MKQAAGARRFFLILYIGACLVVFPGYAHFYNLTEIDVFRGAHFENHVLGDHLANWGKKWEGFGLADYSQIFSQDPTFSLHPVPFPFLSPSKDYFPLRC